MQNIIIISAILAVAASAPALYIEGHNYIHTPVYPVVHELSSLKSTLTKSSQVVNHGGTEIHTPVYHVPVVHELSAGKTTVTKSSQVVNHGGTSVVHAPVYHIHEHVPLHDLSAKSTVSKSQVVNHGSVLHHVMAVPVHVGSAKSTVTKSSQVVNHGGSTLVHAPVYSHVYDYAPVVYSSVKTGDSAISHHSSTVHKTEPVVNHYPLYAYHH